MRRPSCSSSGLALIGSFVAAAILIGPAAVAAGSSDLNGDGRDELLVGASVVVDERGYGAISTLPGSPDGLTLTGSLWLTQRWPAIAHPLSAAAFGSHPDAIATADFNGDGRDDVAVGAPSEDIADKSVGALYVVYGSKHFYSRTHGQRFSPKNERIPSDPQELHEFAQALTTGDFDGDGFDDVAVSTREHFPSGPGEGSQYGSVHVFYGSKRGLRVRRNPYLTAPEEAPGGSVSGALLFGGSLEAGDFNGDGRDELAVATDPYDEGAVLVYRGTREGIVAGENRRLHEGLPGLDGSGAYYGDGFGYEMTTADFDGDRREDLAISTADAASTFHGGEVYVLYGSRRGIRAAGSLYLSPEDPRVLSDSGVHHWGSTLAAGDLDADGRDELAIGATEHDPSYVSIFFAGPEGIGFSDQMMLTEADLPGDGPMNGSRLGERVAMVNVNGRGPDELVITEPQSGNELTGRCVGSGGFHILYPNQARELTANGYGFFTPDTPGMPGVGGQVCHRFGNSIAQG